MIDPVRIGDATLYTGDVLSVLATMPDESVHCVVTSPPYWGLRDYGTGTWEGGEPGCDHKGGALISDKSTLAGYTSENIKLRENGMPFRDICGKCGARRIDQQIGLEETPEQYVAKMVAVFRQVRRVLRKDGTAWVNLGDSYAASSNTGGTNSIQGAPSRVAAMTTKGHGIPEGMKPKDLVGIPWMVAFALRADGWYLRSDIIWAKPNPMPESVTDRPTKAHENVFLLAKGQWKSRVVKFSNLSSERFHLLKNLGTNREAVGFPAGYAVDLAAAILDLPEFQENEGLPPFYSEVWKKRADGSDSDFVRGLPVHHRPAVWASRFLVADATTKEFFCEMNRLFVALPNGDNLLKRWTPPARFDSPHIAGDGKGTVTVHYPGQICKVDLVHGEVSISEPKGCVYFYDAEAVREGITEQTAKDRVDTGRFAPDRNYPGATDHGNGRLGDDPGGKRNRRTVWTIATEPYPEAHFATFPRKLVQPCILAGCPEHACPQCGAPWEKEVEHGEPVSTDGTKADYRSPKMDASIGDSKIKGRSDGWTPNHMRPSRILGERPTCDCGLPPIGGTVLDPFGGSGTTAEVALEYGRRAILIELKPEYVALAKRRLAPVAGRPMLNFAQEVVQEALDL